jgi:hypothetical protein
MSGSTGGVRVEACTTRAGNAAAARPRRRIASQMRAQLEDKEERRG